MRMIVDDNDMTVRFEHLENFLEIHVNREEEETLVIETPSLKWCTPLSKFVEKLLNP